MNPVKPPVDTDLPKHIRGLYQLQDSTMTLAEGLAEYYRVNPGLYDPKDMDNPVSALWFRCHDTTHVIFGTHTGDLDEACNDWYALFGVDQTAREYLQGFSQTEASTDILKYYLNWGFVETTYKAFLLLLPVRRLAKAMPKKWPWHPSEKMYQTPICELRAEYGIQVAHAHTLWANR